MSLRRWISRFVVVAALLLLAVLPARAANDTLGLSVGDYALWQMALVGTLQAKQVSFSYDAAYSLDGLRILALGMALKGQGQVDLSGSSPSVAFDAAGTLRFGSDYTTPVDLQTRVIGGKLYANTAGAQQPAWQVMPYDAASVTFTGGLFDAATPATIDLSFLAGKNQDVSGFYEIVPGLLKLKPSGFVTAVRQPDANGLAHFQFTLDSAAMIASKEFVDLIGAFNQDQGTRLAASSPKQLAAYAAMMAPFFKPTVLTLDGYVDPTTKLIQRLTVDMKATLDPSVIQQTDGPLTSTAHIDLSFDKVGQPQNIAVPDGAKTVNSLAFPFSADVSAVLPDKSSQTVVRIGVVAEKGPAKLPLTLKSGQKLTVTVTGLGWDFDPTVTLLAPDGSQAALNDNHDSKDFALWPLTAQVVAYSVSKDGTYTAQVQDSDGYAGSFFLTAQISQ